MKLFKNMFNKANRDMERKINAEMTYRKQERAFRQYDQDLDRSIRKFENMAVQANESGQRGNALCAARFVNRMKQIKERVASVRQHFEMLHSLGTISDIMVQFMDTCSGLGCNLREQIDIKSLSESQFGMEEGLNKLSYITECVEQAFAQIESGLGLDDATNPEPSEDDQRELDEILMRHTGASRSADPVVDDKAKEHARIEGAGAVSNTQETNTNDHMTEWRRRLEPIGQ